MHFLQGVTFEIHHKPFLLSGFALIKSSLKSGGAADAVEIEIKVRKVTKSGIDTIKYHT